MAIVQELKRAKAEDDKTDVGTGPLHKWFSCELRQPASQSKKRKSNNNGLSDKASWGDLRQDGRDVSSSIVVPHKAVSSGFAVQLRLPRPGSSVALLLCGLQLQLLWPRAGGEWASRSGHRVGQGGVSFCPSYSSETPLQNH